NPGLSAFGAAAELNGSIYVFGGVAGPPGPTQILNTLWIYDTANDVWAAGANLPGPRFGAAIAAINGKIIIAGGSDGTVALSTTLEYDPQADTYTPKASLPSLTISPTFRIHGVALPSLGEVHVFAGSFDGMNHLVYNVGTDAWSVAAA